MKNLSIKHKIILFLNYIAVVLLLVAFISVYIPAGKIPFLALSSLVFPFLVLLNIFFLIYWLVNFKKYFILSLVVLLLNYNNLQALFQWSGKHPIEPKGFSLMSYNVRLFNAYNWIKKKGIDVDISNYLKDEFPDILLLQEFKNDPKTDFTQYKYMYKGLKGKKRKAGLAIFSKYKIINQGNLDFKNTYNNAIWVDMIIKKDTVRIYNIHLQSYKIVKPESLVEEDKVKVNNWLQKVFARQHLQAEQIRMHMEKSPYPTIVAGDFNNTAFSSPYHVLKENMTDAFVDAGEGFGFTWHYKWVPFRIDFILSDSGFFDVLQYDTKRQIEFSDHYPIQALLRIKER